MSLIKHCRCDDRLMHGQVIYKWVEELKVNEIVVVDDEVKNDVIKKGLIRLAAPKNLHLEILSVSEAIRFFYNQDCSDEILVLISNMETAQKMIDSKINIEKLTLGRIPTGVGRKKITSNVYLSKRDINILSELISKNIKIVIQMVPDEEEVDLNNDIEEIKRRYFE